LSLNPDPNLDPDPDPNPNPKPSQNQAGETYGPGIQNKIDVKYKYLNLYNYDVLV